MTEIPQASSFSCPRKVGHLKKLTGKGWIYSGCWKRRYCVLDGTKFYFYEGETSHGNEKTAGVISLDYYDLCEEGTAKDNKRTANFFTVGTSVRGFFDNRHQFSAESSEERDEWMKAIHNAIDEARSNRCRAGRSKHSSKRESNIDDKKGKTAEVVESERQRSASLSGLTEIIEDGESEHRKSQSMEAVIDGTERNQSTDNSNEEEASNDNEASFNTRLSILLGHSPKGRQKAPGPDQGAFLRELESKVGAPQPQSKRHISNSEEQSNDIVLNVKNSVEVVRSRITLLGTHIEHVEKDVVAVRNDVNKMKEQMVVNSANDVKFTEQTSQIEKRLDTVLKEVNIMFQKAQEALQEAQKTKEEYNSLKEEFRDLFKSNPTVPLHDSVPNIIEEI